MSNLLKVTGLLEGVGYGEKNYAVIKEAIKESIAGSYDGIQFPSGEYELYNKRAIELFEDMLKGKFSSLDYDYMYANRNRVFALVDVDNYSIIGDNTVFLFDGLLAPFDFISCSNITLKGVTVEWINPPYFTADVIGKQGNKIIIKPSANEKIVGGEPVVSIQNVDLKTGEQGGMSLFCDISNILYENGEYSFTCAEPEMLTVGESLVLRYVYNYAPAIHLYRCNDVELYDVTLRSAAGMGIIGQKTKNVKMDNLVVRPKEGRVMSTNTDATHFINCSGKIEFDGCYFEGMGDDATNVHGFYLNVKDIDNGCIYATQDAISQDGIPYIPDAGQSIELVRADSLQPYATAVINSVSEDRNMICIELKGGIPENVKIGDCIANTTEVAQLEFKNCTVNNIRGRGTLVQTRGAVIENCTFKGCTGEGIHICTETGWWESISTRDITVKNNRFIDCGFGSTMYCDAVAVVVSSNAPTQTVGLHKGIKICNNEIKGNNVAALITCAEDVEFSENTLIGSAMPVVRTSNNVIIKDNICK